jgi:GDP-D-mannose dehydratase
MMTRRVALIAGITGQDGAYLARFLLGYASRALSRALQRWGGKLAKIGLESGSNDSLACA